MVGLNTILKILFFPFNIFSALFCCCFRCCQSPYRPRHYYHYPFFTPPYFDVAFDPASHLELLREWLDVVRTRQTARAKRPCLLRVPDLHELRPLLPRKRFGRYAHVDVVCFHRAKMIALLMLLCVCLLHKQPSGGGKHAAEARAARQTRSPQRSTASVETKKQQKQRKIGECFDRVSTAQTSQTARFSRLRWPTTSRRRTASRTAESALRWPRCSPPSAAPSSTERAPFSTRRDTSRRSPARTARRAPRGTPRGSRVCSPPAASHTLSRTRKSQSRSFR